MPIVEFDYEKLPTAVKDNITEEQWKLASGNVVPEGARVPHSTIYINLKNGLCKQYEATDVADGPLLATHDLSGGGGQDDTQFRSDPPGAHRVWEKSDEAS